MITRRRCSRFASAKVRLFRKLAKDWERFFKENAKKGCRKDNKRREEGGYTLFIIYWKTKQSYLLCIQEGKEYETLTKQRIYP